MNFLRLTAEKTVSLDLYIQPKASRDTICGLHGGELKLTITAPPIEGKANKAVITYLAKLFGVSKSCVSIVSGLQSRHKRCSIEGITIEKAENIVKNLL